nr:MAG TPA: hypothetical protein [Caudoviricetes sp.]
MMDRIVMTYCRHKVNAATETRRETIDGCRSVVSLIGRIRAGLTDGWRLQDIRIESQCSTYAHAYVDGEMVYECGSKDITDEDLCDFRSCSQYVRMEGERCPCRESTASSATSDARPSSRSPAGPDSRRGGSPTRSPSSRVRGASAWSVTAPTPPTARASPRDGSRSGRRSIDRDHPHGQSCRHGLRRPQDARTSVHRIGGAGRPRRQVGDRSEHDREHAPETVRGGSCDPLR